MARDTRYVVGATVSCLVLAFCLAAAITAQASDSWWRIETDGSNGTYQFGLYYVCMERSNETYRCFQFDKDGMLQFTLAHVTTVDTAKPILKPENLVTQTVWMLSFFAILFTGIAFLLSVPTLFQSCMGSTYKSIPYLQSLFTAIGVILGVTSVAYAYDERGAMWPTGVDFLESLGIATGEVTAQGRGFLFQCIYCSVESIAFAIYAYLVSRERNMSKI